MDDKAPSYNSQFQEQVESLSGLILFLWPGNSLDLNMIEPC